jgi:hypothetical protein
MFAFGMPDVPPWVASLERAIVRRSGTLCRVVAYLAASLVAASFAYHLARGSLAYLGLLEDDSFYYSIVADKLVTLGKLTYDGTTSTNGFHPLWFGVILLLRVVAGGLNGAFYVMLTATFLSSMIVVYELSRTFARELGASAALAPAIALLHCVAADRLVSTGMETAVSVPLVLWLLIEIARAIPLTPARAARLGFVASLAILARLDIAIVILFGLAGWLAASRPALSQIPRVLLPFCAAGVAVPLYAAFNVRKFGSVLPVSALAKQLVKRRGFNAQYLHALVVQTPFGRTVGVSLVLGAAAAYYLWRRRTPPPWPMRPEALFAGSLALVFAFGFYLANALSGWVLFGWYAYPLVPALIAALTFMGVSLAPRVPAAWRLHATAGAVALVALLASSRGVRYFVTYGLRWSVEDNGLLAMSVSLADRMRDRPGVFGMGAINGFASYALKKPVVQLEGLAADRAMVEHVRREDELGRVLREYGVDYLIVSLYATTLEKHEGCYLVTQPDSQWAGDRVAKMHGELCAEPIEHFPTVPPGDAWSQFVPLDTYVFDVRHATWRTD